LTFKISSQLTDQLSGLAGGDGDGGGGASLIVKFSSDVEMLLLYNDLPAVQVGNGEVMIELGDFYAEEAPKIRLRQPGRRWHLAKVAFEKYWLRRWF
jgi:hypothetical protein